VYIHKIVIDTNIVISAALNSKGSSAKIVEFVSDGLLSLHYNDYILAEYEEVLSRVKFAFSLEKQKAAIDMIIKYGYYEELAESDIPFIDEDDRPFYDAAKSIGAFLTYEILLIIPFKKRTVPKLP